MADWFCFFIRQINSSLSLKEDKMDFIYGYAICGYKSNGYIMSIICYEISLVVQSWHSETFVCFSGFTGDISAHILME